MRAFSAKDIARLEELESALARMRGSTEYWRRSSNANYDRLRRLENAVRAHAHDPAHPECTELLRLIPRHPRPTLTELRKKLYKKARAGRDQGA